MEASSYRDHEADSQPSSSPVRRRNATGPRSPRRVHDVAGIVRSPSTGRNYEGEDNTNTTIASSITRPYATEDYNSYSPSRMVQTVPSRSYLGSFCRWCCTFQHFCYIVQLVNCGLVCALIYLALLEYPKIEALEAQVEEDKREIDALSEEVREKQEGQIQSLHKAVEEEQQFNFFSLAGFFTLLTCLISMFHMSTHVHKMNQPKIQRKIIAILWMSPIYSVTSFLTLIFPNVEGWMAIIKDFYESYCIFVFLSFLIAVLGEGSREQAVNVLAKHADHLDRPTRCLSCFYEPAPDTSDLAKANAVMTQCQIYCLQFTLVRPLTTIFSVFVLHRGNEQHEQPNEDVSNDDEFADDIFTDSREENNGNSEANDKNDEPRETGNGIDTSIETNGKNEDTELDENDTLPTNTTQAKQPDTLLPSDSSGTETISDNKDRPGGDGTRQLESMNEEPSGLGHRNLDDTGSTDTFHSMEDATFGMGFPSVAPITESNQFPPTFPEDNFPMGTPPSSPTRSPSILSGFGKSIIPTLAPVAIAVTESVNNITSAMDVNNTGIGGLAENTTNIYDQPTAAPLGTGANETTFDSGEIVNQTKNYLKSPGFAVAMVVNVSIFFAFSGLLKLYHAVREDLVWCRPFPKFLTIKAVVFVTFWQGLVLLIWLVLTAAPDEKEEAYLTARKYQNLLICVEMLLVAISQWCVFPAVEWEPDFQPQQMQTPGLGISDFVSDVGQIVKRRKKTRRKKRMGGKRELYDGISTPGGNVTGGRETFDDEIYGNSSSESGSNEFMDDFTIGDRDENELRDSMGNINLSNVSEDEYSNDDNDMEML